MNILYVHGFGSKFDPAVEKVKHLSTIGTVFGVDLNYTKPDQVAELVKDAIFHYDIDLIVGTSMGAWVAATQGVKFGIPFVAINPCFKPSEMLQKYKGKGVDHSGREYNLTEEAIAQYANMPLDEAAAGMVLVDEGDEVIPFESVIDYVGLTYSLITFEGGSHRFDHMKEAVRTVEMWFTAIQFVYGFDE